MKKILCLLYGFCLCLAASAQTFNHADSLRGSDGPGRNWWDVTKYDLHVTFNLTDSSISGYNVISFKNTLTEHADYLQIDLQEPMQMDSVRFQNHSSPILNNRVSKDGNAYFISLPPDWDSEKGSQLSVYFHGRPRMAVHPPWDGGIIWKKDKAGDPWISIACQGLGASVWYPCKDIQSDEPDSAEMHITAPTELTVVSNGRLTGKEIAGNGNETTTWKVVSPINNYNIIPYIGKYVHFGEIYKGEKGDLTMDYWVLDSNLQKAKLQFLDAPRMMKAFEYWFGPYPFYEDGYKLVDAPHLGMEHQSAVAYGNGYLNGYHGSDLSGSGWGMKWDFIIVHESGHEWFGNNITARDMADNWIHEGFTNYSETLFTEYYFGKEAATAYVTGLRKKIENKEPIIGPYGVNKDGPIDIYYKASNMIHTIRQVIDNDTIFRKILRGLNTDFYHQLVTSKQVEDYISLHAGKDLSKIFDQYLRSTQIPVLEYCIKNGELSFQWTNSVKGFDMPVKISGTGEHYHFIYPTDKIKKMKTTLLMLQVDENFYIKTHQIN
ncbi:MAG: M1 family metallopeptidase [Ginsengibacter sp.]